MYLTGSYLTDPQHTHTTYLSIGQYASNMADTMCFRDIPTQTMFTLQAKYMQAIIQFWKYSYLDIILTIQS